MSNNNNTSENSKPSEEASSKSGAKSKRKRTNPSSASQSSTQESPELDSSENKEWRFHTLSYNNSNASLSTEQRRSCSFYGTEVPLVKWKFSNVGNSFTSTNAAGGEAMDFPNFSIPQPVQQQPHSSSQTNQTQTNASPNASFFHDFVLEDPSPSAAHKKRKIPITTPTVSQNSSSNLSNFSTSVPPIVPLQVPSSSQVPQPPQSLLFPQQQQQQQQVQFITPLQLNIFPTMVDGTQPATPSSSSSTTSTSKSPQTPTINPYRIDPSQMLQASTETWMQLINELISANSRLQFENNQLKAQNSDLLRRLQDKSEAK